MLYFDTHAHYDWKEFDVDREKLFKEFENNLCGIVNVGINCESINKVIEYSKKNSFMYFSMFIILYFTIKIKLRLKQRR